MQLLNITFQEENVCNGVLLVYDAFDCEADLTDNITATCMKCGAKVSGTPAIIRIYPIDGGALLDAVYHTLRSREQEAATVRLNS